MIKQLITTVRDGDKWLLKGEVTARDWQSLAGGLGIKYVLVGEIKNFTLRKRGVYGLYKPSTTVNIKVYDAVKGRKAHASTIVVEDVSGGHMPLMDISSFPSDEKIETRLLAEAAKRIGQELYGYWED